MARYTLVLWFLLLIIAALTVGGCASEPMNGLLCWETNSPEVEVEKFDWDMQLSPWPEPVT